MLDVNSQSVSENAAGLVAGCEVITLTGIRAVETLRSGDRIVTRSGARPLKAVSHSKGGFCLEFDRPQVVLLAEGQVYSDTGMPYAA